MFRFVGYLEEEAVVTYTDILRLLDTNQLPMWKNLPAPPIAVRYTQVSSVPYQRRHLNKRRPAKMVSRKKHTRKYMTRDGIFKL